MEPIGGETLGMGADVSESAAHSCRKRRWYTDRMERRSCFLLSAEAFDRRGCLTLRFYALCDHGEALEIEVEGERAVFFVPCDTKLPEEVHPSERRALPLRSMDGMAVEAVYFASLAEYRKAVDLCNAARVRTFESDVAPADRYLMERFIHGQCQVRGLMRRTDGLLAVRQASLMPAEAKPNFRMASLDIETGSGESILYSIAVHLTGRSPATESERVFIFDQAGERTSDPPWLSRHVNERALMQAFLAWFAQADPDIVLGWHVIGFDLDVLQRTCARLGLPFALGRGGRQARIRRSPHGRWYADVPGRVVLDAPVLLRNAFYHFEDYRLETVAQALLGTGKEIHASDEAKVAEIDRLFREDKVALASYNLQDARLVSSIFAKTALLEMQVKRTQISGLLLDQIGRSVAAFDHVMLPRLHRQGRVAPNVRDVVSGGHAAGGYVMDPVAGLYRDVVVLDFRSLYPSIIRTFNIDPLSRLIAAEHPTEDLIRTPDGFAFSRHKHILPAMIESLLMRRAEAKRAGDPYLSQAVKILMNSFYGVMGSVGCRFYHPDLPSAITGTGQWLLKGCRTFLEEAGYRVLYGDTDSVFVQLPAWARAREGAQGAEAGQALAVRLNDYWRKRMATEFGVESHLEMEYEKHYLRFLLPPARGSEEGAKKRYAGLRREGDQEVLDFVGMEYVRSDWTPLAKTFQYELYWRLFHDEDVQAWMRSFVNAVRSGTKDDQLVYYKRLRKDEKEYTWNVPPQVKAARMLGPGVREVRYVMTPEGPVPIQLKPAQIDYRHYIEKQLAPIADAVLPLIGQSFEDIVGMQQMWLFDKDGVSKV